MVWQACIAGLLGLWVAVASAEDRVVIATGNDLAQRQTLVGEVVDFNGKELTLRKAAGQAVTVPTAQVLELTSTWNEPTLEGDRLAAAHKYDAAIEAYRRAVTAEPRPWAKRRILASVVTCFENLGQIDRAGEAFLILLQADEHGQYFERIPLAWLTSLSSAKIEQRAQRWLANEQSPASQLLGASWSLGGANRNQALSALRKLSTNSDPRIAQLAEAQRWRVNMTSVDKSELSAWQAQIQKMPSALRLGPYLVLAKGYAVQDTRDRAAGDSARQAAAWNYLRAPILFPERHALAAQGLEGAAAELQKLGQNAEAKRLYQELVSHYGDTTAAQVAQQQLTKLKAPQP